MQIISRQRRISAIAVTAILFVIPISVPAGADTGQSQNTSAEVSEEDRTTQEGQMMQDGSRTITGTGQVNKIAAQHHMLSITHEPISEMNWPRMKMNFRTSDDVDLSVLQPGQKVQFVMEVDEGNNYLITDIKVVE